VQWANTAKSYSTSDLQTMMQVGMTDSNNSYLDWQQTHWSLQVVAIWCIADESTF